VNYEPSLARQLARGSHAQVIAEASGDSRIGGCGFLLARGSP